MVVVIGIEVGAVTGGSVGIGAIVVGSVIIGAVVGVSSRCSRVGQS